MKNRVTPNPVNRKKQCPKHPAIPPEVNGVWMVGFQGPNDIFEKEVAMDV